MSASRKAVNDQPNKPRPCSDRATVGIAVATAIASNAVTLMTSVMPASVTCSRRRGVSAGSAGEAVRVDMGSIVGVQVHLNSRIIVIRMKDVLLTIGEVSRRSGVAASALRFYEDAGLLQSNRAPGGARQYPRTVLRRIAVIQAAKAVGMPLADLRQAMAALPNQRTPTKADWERLSRSWRARLDERIEELQRVRDGLTSCIGCGCLSLRSCALFNPADALAAQGAGARRLINPPG
jgi:MerR family transcriptional regulator, redox-sensitive transcriptional activator SoxR